MDDSVTWNAILQQWPWFGAATEVLVVVVGLLVLFRPKSKRGPATTSSAGDNKGWTLTGRIDFVDSHSYGEHCFKSRKPELLIVQAVWSIGKFVGEGRHSMKSRWFWSLTTPNGIF